MISGESKVPKLNAGSGAPAPSHLMHFNIGRFPFLQSSLSPQNKTRGAQFVQLGIRYTSPMQKKSLNYSSLLNCLLVLFLFNSIPRCSLHSLLNDRGYQRASRLNHSEFKYLSQSIDHTVFMSITI